MVGSALVLVGPSPVGAAEAQSAAQAVKVPEPTPEAIRFYTTGHYYWVAGRIVAMAIPAAFLFTGASARLGRWAGRIGRSWYGTIAVYLAAYLSLVFLIELPWNYLRGFVRSHAYGLSVQSLPQWLGDALKGLGVEIVGAVLFGWVPFLLMARSPRRWWLWTSGLYIPFVLFGVMIKPVWIDPLFDEFGPMRDRALESRILDLASRAGIEGSRVFEVDKSRDTTTVNAYVTGLGGTKRIVLWDTLLAKLDEPEILVIVGHEMGHYVLGHVIRSALLSASVVLIGLYAIHRLASGLIVRFRDRFGFDRLADVASVPLILLLVQVVSLVATPVVYTYSRYQEREADRFALELTRDNHAGAMSFVKLQRENLGYPRPGLFYKIWRSTHPTYGERIDFFNSYQPWKTGEPMAYESHFGAGPPEEARP